MAPTSGTEKPEPTLLGQRIRAARELAGLSMREAGQAAGISQTTWQQLEHGYYPSGGQWLPKSARSGTIIAVAQAVGLDPAEALRLAGHDPSKVAAPLRGGQPPLSAQQLTERVQALTPRQRAAVLELIDSIVAPDVRAEGEVAQPRALRPVSRAAYPPDMDS